MANFFMDGHLKINFMINERAVAQTNLLPFDRLRANGDILKSCDFSAHAEPFDSPFALRLSKGERFAQDRLVEA